MTSSASTMKKPPLSGPGGGSLWISDKQQQTRQRWRELMTKTTETTGIYTVEVDEDGTKFVELGHRATAWEAYLGLLKQRAEIDAAIERARTFFEYHMNEANVDGMMINGVKVVTYKKDATFPAAKFARENPGIAAAFMTTKEVLDVEALKQHRPQDYQNWRGRSFKLVQRSA